VFRRYATARSPVMVLYRLRHTNQRRERSSTVFNVLHLWYFAIYMMTSTRCGVSAKMLEREIGVSYKTAWRMLRLIAPSLWPTMASAERRRGGR